MPSRHFARLRSQVVGLMGNVYHLAFPESYRFLTTLFQIVCLDWGAFAGFSCVSSLDNADRQMIAITSAILILVLVLALAHALLRWLARRADADSSGSGSENYLERQRQILDFLVVSTASAWVPTSTVATLETGIQHTGCNKPKRV